jgi:hypothetical protein
LTFCGATSGSFSILAGKQTCLPAGPVSAGLPCPYNPHSRG